MDNLSKLKQTLREMADSRVPVTLVWATAEVVDWEKKTMMAMGVMDDLPYYDVSLGLGNEYVKPVAGSKCLLGLIQNNDAAAILIDCEDVEEIILNANDEFSLKVNSVQFDTDGNRWLIKNSTEDLLTLLSDTIDAILAERHLTNTGPTINLTADSILRFTNLKTRFNNLLKST